MGLSVNQTVLKFAQVFYGSPGWTRTAAPLVFFYSVTNQQMRFLPARDESLLVFLLMRDLSAAAGIFLEAVYTNPFNEFLMASRAIRASANASCASAREGSGMSPGYLVSTP